jgi:hypothetical protein
MLPGLIEAPVAAGLVVLCAWLVCLPVGECFGGRPQAQVGGQCDGLTVEVGGGALVCGCPLVAPDFVLPAGDRVVGCNAEDPGVEQRVMGRAQQQPVAGRHALPAGGHRPRDDLGRLKRGVQRRPAERTPLAVGLEQGEAEDDPAMPRRLTV